MPHRVGGWRGQLNRPPQLEADSQLRATDATVRETPVARPSAFTLPSLNSIPSPEPRPFAAGEPVCPPEVRGVEELYAGSRTLAERTLANRGGLFRRLPTPDRPVSRSRRVTTDPPHPSGGGPVRTPGIAHAPHPAPRLEGSRCACAPPYRTSSAPSPPVPDR